MVYSNYEAMLAADEDAYTLPLPLIDFLPSPCLFFGIGIGLASGFGFGLARPLIVALISMPLRLISYLVTFI